MARGARFLKVTPCNYADQLAHRCLQASSSTPLGNAYSLVHVDGVLSRDNVRNGGARRLAAGLLSLGRGHRCADFSVTTVVVRKVLRRAGCEDLESAPGSVRGLRV